MDKQQYTEAVAKAQNNQMPKASSMRQCCATCDLLSATGECQEYGEWPPLEYLEEKNQCEHWLSFIPF